MKLHKAKFFFQLYKKNREPTYAAQICFPCRFTHILGHLCNTIRIWGRNINIGIKQLSSSAVDTNPEKAISYVYYCATCTIHAYIEFYSMYDRIGLCRLRHTYHLSHCVYFFFFFYFCPKIKRCCFNLICLSE